MAGLVDYSLKDDLFQVVVHSLFLYIFWCVINQLSNVNIKLINIKLDNTHYYSLVEFSKPLQPLR